MSSIIYQTNKTTGAIYAYESESYRDPVTKKPKSKRTYIGRVDPDTKLIIPKAEGGKRNRAKSAATQGVLPDEVIAELSKQKETILQLQEQIKELSRKEKESAALISKMKQLLNNYD